MARTTITLHLPAYRRRALALQTELREAEAAYDTNIGAYVAFLKREADAAGYVVTTDQHDDGHPYSIHEIDHAQKKAAHDWLGEMPDIWNWIP